MPRFDHTSVVLPDGSIVLMGGQYFFSDVWRSTDQGATWTPQPYIYKARSGHTSVTLPDGSIVLMGGGLRNDVWRSADQGATWTQLTAAAPWTARSGHTSVSLSDGSIVLMGGRDTTGRRNDVWRSIDQGATWTQLTSAAEWMARDGHTSVALPDGSIVLMGGIGASGPLKNDVWRSIDQGATWTQLTDAADWTKRYDHTSVTLPDGSIVLMGGICYPVLDKVPMNDVWRSTDQGATWTQMTATAEWTARAEHASVALPDSSIVLMGGFDGSNPLNDIWRSINQGATWTQMTAAAEWTARSGHTSVTLPDGSIVLMGQTVVWRLETAGSNDQNPSHIYTEKGIYSVALQVYNADGFSSKIKKAYINTTGSIPDPDPDGLKIFLPLILH